jgi:hypothetical protein
MTEAKGEVVFYQEQDGSPKIDVTLVDNTLWLSQRSMADLFEKDTDTIGDHIKNIYAEEELAEEATTTSFEVALQQGKRTAIAK